MKSVVRDRRSLAEPRRGLGRSVPALVFEGEMIPKLPIDTVLGAVTISAGTVLLGEALWSLFLSPDQGTWQTVFRIFRIAAGGGLVIWVAASSA